MICGRWHVAGSWCAGAFVEEFVTEGMTPEEVVEKAFFLGLGHLQVVIEIACLYRAYLVKVGRLAA